MNSFNRLSVIIVRYLEVIPNKTTNNFYLTYIKYHQDDVIFHQNGMAVHSLLNHIFPTTARPSMTLQECSNHITVSVPGDAQRVELLIDSINCSDSTVQAAIGLIRANTNNMRQNFEAVATVLIEVDPYKRSQRSSGPPRQANVSTIDFSAGRGTTGVDLRWYPRKEFHKLPKEQKEELIEWNKTKSW